MSVVAAVLLAFAVAALAAAGCTKAHDHRAAQPAAHQDHAAHHEHDAAPGHQHGAEGHAGHQGGMHHRFEDAERWAKVFDDPERDSWQRPDEVVALLDLAPGMVAADIGAGTGYFLGRLTAKVGERGTVLATDIEPDMVRYMEERAKQAGWRNVKPVLAKPDDPTLPQGGVDRILIVDVWHHLADRRAFAAHLARALRPGGRIAIVDFELTATKGPPPEHRLAPEAIIEDLRSAGLSVALAKESLAEQYVVVATAR